MLYMRLTALNMHLATLYMHLTALNMHLVALYMRLTVLYMHLSSSEHPFNRFDHAFKLL